MSDKFVVDVFFPNIMWMTSAKGVGVKT